MAVVREPSRALRRLSARVSFGVTQLQRARGNAGLDSQWEALWHAWALTNLVARHSLAVASLSKTDIALLPSAWVVARASMESAARVMWLVAPDDVWEREARWLALKTEAARLHDRMAVWDPASASESRQRAQELRNFIEWVTAQLPTGVIVPGIPTVADMLRPYGDSLEHFYGLASQYVHAADSALGHYRMVDGDRRMYGESVSESYWVPPLRIAWNGFRACTVSLLQAAGEPLTLRLAEFDAKIHEAAESVLNGAASN